MPMMTSQILNTPIHAPNFSSCISLVITKHELKLQHVKLTQLWPLTVNFVKVSSQSYLAGLYHKIVKNLFICTFVDQMIIQQRLNVLLQLHFYNIFTNVLSKVFTDIFFLSNYLIYIIQTNKEQTIQKFKKYRKIVLHMHWTLWTISKS